MLLRHRPLCLASFRFSRFFGAERPPQELPSPVSGGTHSISTQRLPLPSLASFEKRAFHSIRERARLKRQSVKKIVKKNVKKNVIDWVRGASNDQGRRTWSKKVRPRDSDLAFVEAIDEVIAGADRDGHHRQCGILASGRDEACAVHHENIFYVVRLIVWSEH